MSVRIETPRLLLRTLEVGDVSQAYVDWLNDPEVNRYLETRFSRQTLESCRDFVEHCNGSASEHLLGIFFKETGSHIGNAKLGLINAIHARGQLSLLIGEKSLWGKGLAREVIRAVSQYGFEQVNLEKIEAGCYESNLSSLRAFMAVGYNVDGFFRSHAISDDGRRMGCFWMSILRSEFTP